MRLLLIGGTGYVGGHLTRALVGRGDEVTIASRTPDSVSRRLSVPVQACGLTGDELRQGAAGRDAVINLAGANIFDRRWDDRYKRTLRESRVVTTQRIVDALAALPAAERPRVLVNASAIGFYGDTGAREVTESSDAGSGFLAELCRDWEEAAARAALHEVRVVQLRVGVVLSADDGALKRMALPFRLFAGGRVGSGRQWMSWIHLDDAIALVLRCLDDDSLSGPVNLTAPQPVTMGELASTLGRVLRRPAWAPVPGFALRLVLGEVAEVLLSGTRALPRKAQDAGFAFRHPDVDDALRDLLK